MPASVRVWLTLALFFAALALGGCADAPSATDLSAKVRAEPAQVVFHPETKETVVEVVNITAEPLAVGKFRIEGSDWASFALLDPLNETVIPPGARFRVRIGADGSTLKGPKAQVDSIVASDPQAHGAEIGADEYRMGTATLRFDAGGVEHSVLMWFEDPSWVWQQLVPALVKIPLIVLAFVMPLASLLTWMERKQSAMMQDRLGPNMARITLGGLTLRLWGLIHIATDGLKMLFKEDFIPRRAHRALYNLAPLMSLIPALVVFAIVPFGDALCYDQMLDVVSQADVDQCVDGRGGTALQIAHIDVGLLYYFAIASLATYGTTMAGWASYNKWAILGGLRASAQMISYEVAIGLTIVGALLVYGTLEPHTLVRAQLDTWWGIALQPIAFVLFFTAAIAETKRAPFDLPEGDSEIIGYFIEYSGMRFGLFYLGEFIEIVFVSALVATIFLGGWALPFGVLGAQGFASPLACQLFLAVSGVVIAATGAAIRRADKRGELVGSLVALVGISLFVLAGYSVFTGWGTGLPHIVVVAIGMATWGVKVLALCWLQLLIRWTLPRFRYDQLMALGWKGLLPLSIANIVLTAIVVYFLSSGGDPSAAEVISP